MRTPDTIFAVVTLLFFAIALGILVRESMRKKPAEKPAPEPAQDKQDPPSSVYRIPPQGPVCQAGPGCGQLATERMPKLARGRGSVLRDLFSMPPSYRRVVDSESSLTLCRSHAHVADSRMAEFVAEQRAVLSRLYAQVAQRAAVFEQEELPRMICESLTAEQVKNARRSVPSNGLALVRRTGTEDA